MDATNVEFKDNMYLGNGRDQQVGHAIRNEIARLTVERAPAGAASAKVEVGWHYSDPRRKGSDPKEHCTVDYEDERGNVFERVHVYRAVQRHNEPET
ncbi:hypothetical protein FPHYL_3705 [Fusarium phyllophilum]|uniref:Uncharacterized protein n=1 Tax=Fusarium phyllophilum TaxID=47803 RepID=A0A8H5K6C6_9HYPO|nr:hypothetical protein FPHYL_3705 [Fusarium phyllophilum]